MPTTPAPRHPRRAPRLRLALAHRQGRAPREPARPARRRAARSSPASSATRTRSFRPSRTRSSPARTWSSSASAARPRRGWRALLVGLLDEWLPVVRGGELNDDPYRADQPGRPGHRGARRRRDRDRLAAARPALRREAGHARHHDRRPDRRGRPDQGGRGPLPVGRADAPLRADPAREPRASWPSTSCPISPSGSRSAC